MPWVDPQSLEEQRALLTDAQYQRLHLNRWVAADDRLTTPEELAACVPDDEALLEELANLRMRETSSGTLRFDHDAGRHDDRAVALALAAVHLTDRPS